jgi:hypothetical protein
MVSVDFYTVALIRSLSTPSSSSPSGSRSTHWSIVVIYDAGSVVFEEAIIPTPIPEVRTFLSEATMSGQMEVELHVALYF